MGNVFHRVKSLVLASHVFTSALFAQDTLEPGKDPCSIQAKVDPLPMIREADVLWERRVWRVLDVMENGSLFSPQGEVSGCMDLFTIVRHGLLDEGSITAYDPGPMGKDDAFRRAMLRDEIKSLYADLDTMQELQVTRLMIKEDWIFNKQRGEMEVRIIGLAFMIEDRGEQGELRGYRPLFLLYYPECRLLFARWAQNKNKEGVARSFETIFSQRRFTSTIVKVSNSYDRRIGDYRTGIDALLESEAIRNQLYNIGFDLWNY